MTREEALSFAEAWALEDPTEPERLLVSEILCGTAAPRARREACSLMLAAAAYTSSKEVATIRTAMAGHPSPFKPSSELETISGAWRRVQVRQLFRLSLEAIFYWLLKEIEFGRRTTSELVDTFLTRQNSRSEKNSAKEWLDPSDLTNMGPTHLIDRIAIALSDPTRANLSSTISDGLAFCLTGLPEQKNGLDRSDRLPLSRAHSEARAWGPGTTRSFVSHIFEDWVIGQHVYWSVGRGLADARALGKTILQLRVVLEDGGWTLTPGASAGSPPFVTPDRIQTALSLANECKLIIA